MKIYLDVCCLNRPFDDQLQERIKLEAEAIFLIVQKCERGEWTLIGSEVIASEIGQCADRERRERAGMVASAAGKVVDMGPSEIVRAAELEGLGFGAMDSLHLACAESADCDVFLTTDDRLLRRSQRYARALHVGVDNPLNWLAKWVKK
ncbi:MAG: PIN domain-containing protein [Verrucomicrobiae bacterium]|nr:PIN domain-containing protein [Verrucomicrobiae bacterium]